MDRFDKRAVKKSSSTYVAEIPDQILESLEIIPVAWIDEVISNALESEPLPLKKTKSSEIKEHPSKSFQNGTNIIGTTKNIEQTPDIITVSAGPVLISFPVETLASWSLGIEGVSHGRLNGCAVFPPGVIILPPAPVIPVDPDIVAVGTGPVVVGGNVDAVARWGSGLPVVLSALGHGLGVFGGKLDLFAASGLLPGSEVKTVHDILFIRAFSCHITIVASAHSVPVSPDLVAVLIVRNVIVCIEGVATNRGRSRHKPVFPGSSLGYCLVHPMGFSSLGLECLFVTREQGLLALFELGGSKVGDFGRSGGKEAGESDCATHCKE